MKRQTDRWMDREEGIEARGLKMVESTLQTGSVRSGRNQEQTCIHRSPRFD